MDSVVDGVQLNDLACIELSVNYIGANVMASGSGYVRERMARSLRHAPLTETQKRRLANVFLGQLRDGTLHKEFKEYARLFKTIGIDRYHAEIEPYADSKKAYIQRAAGRLLS